MKHCEHCNAPAERDGKAISWADDPAAQAGTITCPHCGAPVKYAVEPVPDAEDMKDPPVPPAAKDAPLPEGAGDADAVEELQDKPPVPPPAKPPVPPAPELDDAPAAEMIEPAGAPEMKDPPAEELAEIVGDGKPPTGGAVDGAAAFAENKRLKEQVRQLSEKNEVTEKKLRETQRTQRRTTAEELTRRGLNEGKLTPKLIGTWEKPGWALAEAYNKPKSFDLWLRETAPIVVDLVERGTGKTADAAPATVALAERIDKLAKDAMAANPKLTYADAVRRVHVENRQLAEQYDREMSVGKDADAVSVTS